MSAAVEERRRPPYQRANEFLTMRRAVSETLLDVWVVDRSVHEWAVDLIAAALFVEGFVLMEN